MDQLLIKYVLNEATAEERRRVEAWVAESAANGRRLEEFRRVWTLGREMAAPVRTDAGAALGRLRERMATGEQPLGRAKASIGPEAGKVHRKPGKSIPVAPVRRIRLGLVAAVIIGLLVVGAGIWIVWPAQEKPPVAVTAPGRASAETTMVYRNEPRLTESPEPPGVPKAPGVRTMIDGLQIALEKDAHIQWLPERGYQRRMRLTGNARFQVKADPTHPFIVETGLLRVKVLGTVFRIRSNADSALVLLDTGGILAATDRDSVVLHPGEMAIVYASQGKLIIKINREQDTKQVMRMLIAELTREGLIEDKEHLGWLALDSRQFIIDDIPLPDSTKARYQSKYLLPDGMGLYYGKVKVHGHGYFYEKKELY